mgnify:CR=1 FL=1
MLMSALKCAAQRAIPTIQQINGKNRPWTPAATDAKRENREALRQWIAEGCPALPHPVAVNHIRTKKCYADTDAEM